MKRLDEKLARIQAGAYHPTDFIIADAKDADMSFGSATPGPEVNEGGQPTGRMKPLQAYRDDMLRVIEYWSRAGFEWRREPALELPLADAR